MKSDKYLDKLWEYAYYSCVKTFYGMKRYDVMKQINAMNLRHHWLFKQKVDYKKRLEPSGEYGSIMFIGTNPSEASSLSNVWEDNYGKFFGSLLDTAGIDANSIWMTNLYKQSTEKNRPLNKEEIGIGREELLMEIAMVSPTVIVALGTQAQSIFGDVYNWIPVVKLSHPSYIQRFSNEEHRSNFINQLRSLKKYVKK